MIEQQTSHHLDMGSTQNESGSDDRLMAAVAEGDCAALEQLYDRHVRRCFGLAVHIVQEPSLAEDIVQEVFTSLWSRPGSFCPEHGRFDTWLLTGVHNLALDKLRQAKTRSEVHIIPWDLESGRSGRIIDVLPDAGPTPHDQAWASDTDIVVRHAIGRLSSHDYQVITLAYFDGLTQQEIAAKLNEPIGTVNTHTRSALHALRELFKSQGLPIVD